MNPRIIYTLTDEAPALATRSLLPIIEAFAQSAGVQVETRDISLSGRILSQFTDYLKPGQQLDDALAELGEMTLLPDANIIKLPNISASQPQLLAAISELQSQGYALPDYPTEVKTPQEEDIKARYDKVKGSAVNPILREGNSDRRAPQAVKNYAKANPHRMGAWSKDSQTRVATMGADDFRSNEKSLTLLADTQARIEFHGKDKSVTVLKDSLPLLAGEILDASKLGKEALLAFLAEQIHAAKEQGVLFSLHMKATMMKVSDPVIFGHAVRVFFASLIEEHAEVLEHIGVNFNNGLGDLTNRLNSLPAAQKNAIEASLKRCLELGPELAMVDSDKGITNLHVPSDVIIDASMPAMIRDSGKMWNREGERQDTLAVIPDSSYAAVYAETIDFCRENGAFDPTTMGTVPNVGLMAKKAEEYGSHDKTFQAPGAGVIKVVDLNGNTLLEHEVKEGDLWRACQTKDASVRDWVKLAIKRARASETPAVFWLDENRAHDAQLIEKVNAELEQANTQGLELHILAPAEATRFTLKRLKAGQDTISVTGNVLRDYLTDLFPILELGTSAKMLSIVPLMQGGGLFETGAGGSAPKHVQQFEAENYLRWDSLGEFLALAESLQHLSEVFDNPQARVLAQSLDAANNQFLLENKSPTRKLGGIDNRGSHFYLALFWAEALANQSEHAQLAQTFQPIAQALRENEATIVDELISVQGQALNLQGYYRPSEDKVRQAMRPSATLNQILAQIS